MNTATQKIHNIHGLGGGGCKDGVGVGGGGEGGGGVEGGAMRR